MVKALKPTMVCLRDTTGQVIGNLAPSAWRDTSKLCKQNGKPFPLMQRIFPSSANAKAPHQMHMCVQLLNKLIYIKVPTWHAEEMRQLALVSAVDTIV
jgi:hypothetical protein